MEGNDPGGRNLHFGVREHAMDEAGQAARGIRGGHERDGTDDPIRELRFNTFRFAFDAKSRRAVGAVPPNADLEDLSEIDAIAVPEPVSAPLAHAAIFLVVAINPGPDNREAVRSFCAGPNACRVRECFWAPSASEHHRSPATPPNQSRAFSPIHSDSRGVPDLNSAQLERFENPSTRPIQIVGKIRLTQTPWLNHSWHVPLYVNARGLTTSVIPYERPAFQIDFDFIDDVLWVRTSDGHVRQLMLAPKSVAEFYAELFAVLGELGLKLHIKMMPCEIADCVPFDQDLTHASYDRDYANRFWRILLSSYRVLTLFRTAFLGKVSPVHFFWGSFDLAVTRFSGRRAPPHPGGIPHLPDAVAREAYSHEVSSAGFLAGQRRSGAGCGILLIRLSGADGLWLGGGAPNAGVLFPTARRIHSALRCGANRPAAREHTDGVSTEHLRGSGRSGALGSYRAGMPVGRCRASAPSLIGFA